MKSNDDITEPSQREAIEFAFVKNERNDCLSLRSILYITFYQSKLTIDAWRA